jgi:hypothetical protein
MPSLLPKKCRNTPIAVSRMLVAELNHSLQKVLFPSGLLLGPIPVAGTGNPQEAASILLSSEFSLSSSFIRLPS